MFFNQPPQLSKENDENLKAREGEWGRDCKTEKREGGVADLGLVEVYSLGVLTTPPGGFFVIFTFRQYKYVKQCMLIKVQMIIFVLVNYFVSYFFKFHI